MGRQTNKDGDLVVVVEGPQRKGKQAYSSDKPRRKASQHRTAAAAEVPLQEQEQTALLDWA